MWLEALKNILIAIIPAILVAIVTANITVKKSLKQFYSQHWWQKKTESYSKIVRDLRNLFYCIKEIYEEALGSKQMDQHRLDTLSRHYRKSFESLKITAVEGDFVISREAAVEMEKFIKNLENNYYNPNQEPLSDYYGREYESVENCLVNIRKFAKKDLEVF